MLSRWTVSREDEDEVLVNHRLRVLKRNSHVFFGFLLHCERRRRGSKGGEPSAGFLKVKTRRHAHHPGLRMHRTGRQKPALWIVLREGLDAY